MIKSAFLTITSMVLSIGLCIAPSKSIPTNTENSPSTTTTANTPAAVLSNQSNLTPAEQARFLLRKIYLTGKVGSELPTLDPELEKRVGQKCLITRDQLRAYLERNHIADWEIGGNIDLPLLENVGRKNIRSATNGSGGHAAAHGAFNQPNIRPG